MQNICKEILSHGPDHVIFDPFPQMVHGVVHAFGRGVVNRAGRDTEIVPVSIGIGRPGWAIWTAAGCTPGAAPDTRTPADADPACPQLKIPSTRPIPLHICTNSDMNKVER